jgi:hypothetical protein
VMELQSERYNTFLVVSFNMSLEVFQYNLCLSPVYFSWVVTEHAQVSGELGRRLTVLPFGVSTEVLPAVVGREHFLFFRFPLFLP